MSNYLCRINQFRLYIGHTHRQSRRVHQLANLSPYDVNIILRKYEYTKELTGGPIKSYDSNQLPSNAPIEDTANEAICQFSKGYMFGVFDGHGGRYCAQVIAKRLMRYIAAQLANSATLKTNLENKIPSHEYLTYFNDQGDFREDIRSLYETRFRDYVYRILINKQDDAAISDVLQDSFLQLDDDISVEALEHSKTLGVALSGAVACVSYINGTNLYVANSGDCSAVLGSINDSGHWQMKKLTHEHNSDNLAEVRRILNEHPETEKKTVIKSERLLGQLAPLRAFGDFRFKWPLDILKRHIVPHYGETAISPNYYTPPYLTARPDVLHHVLTPNDKFLVIASDGLWDMLSHFQVVHLVGEHMQGKAFLQPVKLPKTDVSLGQVADMIQKRQSGMSEKPMDKNAATHLIRNALGGTEHGIEHSKISHMLSLPQDIVRLFRDDITITVIFFDQEYLKNPIDT